MQKPSTSRIETAVAVTVWEAAPGTVIEVKIGKPLSVEQMEELAYLTRASIKMLLKMPGVVDKC